MELEEAIRIGNVDEVRRLLEDRAVVLNAAAYYLEKYDAKLTPLQFAVFHKQAAVAQVLIELGASTDTLTVEEEGPFEFVGRIATFGFWHRSGQYTALHIASNEEGNEACIRLLLAAGANYLLKDNWRRLPLTFEKLCDHLSSSDRLTTLNLKEYGDLTLDRLSRLRRGLASSSIKRVQIKLPDIYLNVGFPAEDKNPNRQLLFDLLESLRCLEGLHEVELNLSILIPTKSEVGSYIPPSELTFMRKQMVRLFNAFVELSKNPSLQVLNLGELIHEHTEKTQKTRTVTKTRYKPGGGMESSLETEYYTETTITKKTLLKLDIGTMRVMTLDHVFAREALRSLNDKMMSMGDLWGRLFSSEEQREAKKILDPEIFIGFCTRIVDNLAHAEEAEHRAAPGAAAGGGGRG